MLALRPNAEALACVDYGMKAGFVPYVVLWCPLCVCRL
jgi:hypothetical protein